MKTAFLFLVMSTITCVYPKKIIFFLRFVKVRTQFKSAAKSDRWSKTKFVWSFVN